MATQEISTKYLKKVEEIIIIVVNLALKTKEKKGKYDDLLQKLFESSLRYTKFNKSDSDVIEHVNFSNFSDDFEKFYLLDIAAMAIWNDAEIETSEKIFSLSIGG